MLPVDFTAISAQYHEQGYTVVRQAFDEERLAPIKLVLEQFHQQWLVANQELYRARAVNSAYLTDKKLLNTSDRALLFQLIGDRKVAQLLQAVFPSAFGFMNTQLFFNPCNPQQKNYWHRDIQYSDLSIEQQIKALGQSNVIHVRLALAPEPGLELIPGSHNRWDTDLEFSVRMAQEGCAVHDELPNSHKIALETGDLLIFSANMIHRGLYGGQRMAFDMLYCDPLPSLLQYVNPDCLPNSDEMQAISCPEAFTQTQRVLQTL